MTDAEKKQDLPVLVKRHSHMMSIMLNRPKALNSLNLEMVRLIREAMDEALKEDRFQFVLFYGKGDRGFCAGGDIKALARAVRDGNVDKADQFFEEEYALDLLIFRFPKPVIIIADGITMGGGLGISAGADKVLATERTRMAMPESKAGFFPDVGATGWMFAKTLPGYPEYLGLTGYEMHGVECVRIGFATDFVCSSNVPTVISTLEDATLSRGRGNDATRLRALLLPFLEQTIPSNTDMDQWVATYFAGKSAVTEIVESLSQCTLAHDLCQAVFLSLSERSPTSLALTLKLIRRNEGHPMEKVYENDARSAHFMVTHPDFLEGVRARLIDKDNQPDWRPKRVEEVDLAGLVLV
ncbi:MAG: enoyl-CoA hydratase/isomerase family protein [Thermodesulfobacteriota bacterium]|nr:enoyl-CoA hydratase/isomerase family protein [Thermodesulfobacteriota bacterium]